MENGVLLKETFSEELTQMFKVGSFLFSSEERPFSSPNVHHYDDNPNILQTFDGTMNSVTVGCNYRKATPPASPYMNMQVNHMHSDMENRFK